MNPSNTFGKAYQLVPPPYLRFLRSSTDLCGVRPEAALGGEPLSADLTVERPVLHPLYLRVVVPQVLLQVRELDEGAAALGVVALVRSFTCGTEVRSGEGRDVRSGQMAVPVFFR